MECVGVRPQDPWAVWFLSYFHALSFMLCSTKMRWRVEHSGKSREKCPLPQELQNTSLFLCSERGGCIRLGNHNSCCQPAAFAMDEKRNKEQSHRALATGCFPKHQRRWQILLQIKANVVVGSSSHHITRCCLKGQGHICEDMACTRITSPWAQPHSGGCCSLTNGYL